MDGPSAYKEMQIRRDPCDSKGYTHTPKGMQKLSDELLCMCERSVDEKMRTRESGQTG